MLPGGYCGTGLAAIGFSDNLKLPLDDLGQNS